MDLPDAVSRLAGELAASAGVVAVVVGGSRATGDADAGSDWDLGVYYSGTVGLAAVEAHGTVHPPGSWGRLMNGGAWLELDGTKVDVLLRDLDAVEHWTAEAGAGRFEVDGLLGYVAGMPTYTLTAELAIARPIVGTLDLDTTYPDALAAAAPARWRFCRDFSLTHAAAHAERGNVAGTLGQAARAVFEEAHARACEQRRWVLNEKRILSGADLEAASELLATAGRNGRAELADLVGRFGVELRHQPAERAQTRIAAASRLAVPPVIAAISALDNGSERISTEVRSGGHAGVGRIRTEDQLAGDTAEPGGRDPGWRDENGRQVGEDSGMGLDQIEGIVDGREPAVGDDHDRLRVAAGDGRDRSQLGAVGLPGRGMAGVDHDRQPDLGPRASRRRPGRDRRRRSPRPSSAA